MKIIVTVKPHARENKVEKLGATTLKISVNAPPEKCKANNEVIKLLAKYYDISPSKIIIISGLKSNKKVIEVYE